MYRLYTNLLVITVLCVSNTWTTELVALNSRPKHCTYERAFDMNGAHCAGLHLESIPDLKTGIEILDFTENRLNEIKAATLSKYTNLRYLYLSDNTIFQIDDDAFASLTYLELLDLSGNVLLRLPSSILQLPSLRSLLLRRNPFLHADKELKLEKPIRAPLKNLDISNCKISKLPDWGDMPQLTDYNISHNPLEVLKTEHFSRMCNLEKVDLTESTNDLPLCGIKSTVMWFKLKRIPFVFDSKYYNKLNTPEFSNCPLEDDFGANNATYHRCKAEYLKVQSIKTSRRTWLTIGGGLAGFLVGFVLLLYVIHRFNVAQSKTKAEKLKQATPNNDPDKNATANLLKNLA